MFKLKTCRICSSNEIEQFLDLGDQPFANALIKDKDSPENKYPLSLSFCNTCRTVQLDYTADPKVLFENYFWVTSTSSAAKDYSNLFCENILKMQDVKSYVLEIASNDGTFLKPFKVRGKNVLGVDPAKNIAELANNEGIETKAAFWGTETADKIITERGFPSIVFARNVMPHVSNIIDFTKGLSHCINDDTLLILEVHYAGKICDELHYDSIYHEHLFYFTLKSLENLLNRFGLYIFDIDKSPISGGSIVVYIKNNQVPKTNKLIEFSKQEEERGYNTLEIWKDFAERTVQHKLALNNMLAQYKNKPLIAYGASARGSTLLNFCEINNIDKIVDKNILKQGFYTPGTHVKIVSLDELIKDSPETVLLLAWNFKDEIIEELKNIGFKGNVVIPLPARPTVEVIE